MSVISSDKHEFGVDRLELFGITEELAASQFCGDVEDILVCLSCEFPMLFDLTVLQYSGLQLWWMPKQWFAQFIMSC